MGENWIKAYKGFNKDMTCRGFQFEEGKSRVGENGIACARGNNVRVKGGVGAVLMIVEENESDCGIKEWKAAVVDGKTLKPDTWYKLEKGEFVEATE